ncbi:MAG: peptide chain release factor N(5)-glutamine methyltransferase [Nitrospinae bacterium]|nr:peptide chain release factor N(5)-glutamine methyltransferase [Nitrospinota bacterium]
MPETITSLLRHAELSFKAAGIPTPRLDAETLMANLLRVDRGYFYAHPETVVTDETAAAFKAMEARRLKREPVAYIAGEKEFYSLSFKVTRDTLIPRPETEMLVEEALRLFKADSRIETLDIGAGSGAIAVTLAKERPAWKITAVDISPAALEVAGFNARTHAVADRIEFCLSDIFSNLGGRKFDLIAANPPYVPEGDKDVSPEAALYEPHSALYAGETGLSVIERIFEGAPEYLTAGGFIAMEIGYKQSKSVSEMINAAGKFDIVKIAPDLAGIDRVVVAQLKE